MRGFARFCQQTYPNSMLTLVGYGPQERVVSALVGNLGIQDRVTLRGRLAHSKVPRLLRAHDVYVQPSIRHPETLQEEGQPIAVLEAIASGMPVIVTDTGGMRETVCVGLHENNAFVIPEKDSDAIAVALQRVLHTRSLPSTMRAYHQVIVERHSLT